MCSKHLRPYSCPLRPWFHYSYGGQFLPLASILPQAYALCFPASGFFLVFQERPLVYHILKGGLMPLGVNTSASFWWKHPEECLHGSSEELVPNCLSNDQLINTLFTSFSPSFPSLSHLLPRITSQVNHSHPVVPRTVVCMQLGGERARLKLRQQVSLS